MIRGIGEGKGGEGLGEGGEDDRSGGIGEERGREERRGQEKISEKSTGWMR